MKCALFLVGFVALGAVGCADPCADLEQQCGDCPGSDSQSKAVESACDAVVNIDDDDACDAALDSKLYVCP